MEEDEENHRRGILYLESTQFLYQNTKSEKSNRIRRYTHSRYGVVEMYKYTSGSIYKGSAGRHEHCTI